MQFIYSLNIRLNLSSVLTTKNHYKSAFKAKMPQPSNKQEVERLVLIDTDAGTDDAWALFLALAAQRDLLTPRIRIVGVTTCSGNTTVDYVANNVTRTLDTFGDNTTPIYLGMDSPMINPFRFLEDPPYHGEDGFGDADLPEIPTRTESEHSVQTIIRLAELHQGLLSIICLGPATNLAMAVKIKPEIKNWIKDIYLLGGNVEGVGNVVGISSSAEFNFYIDPEAVQVVFDNFENTPIYDLPWETMTRFATSTYEFRTETLRNLGTPIISLMDKVEAKNLGEITGFWLAPDPVLVACFIDPTVIKRQEAYRCDMELTGTRTRGMMILDRNPESNKPKNVNVILDIDLPKYEAMLIWAAGGPRP